MYPLLDVVSAIADVLTHTKGGWSPSSVPPPVERVERHIQVVGKVLGCKQLVELAHPGMVRREGYERMTDRCQIRSFLLVIDLSSICNSFDMVPREASVSFLR